jgi:hypothetical protein
MEHFMVSFGIGHFALSKWDESDFALVNGRGVRSQAHERSCA